MDKVQNQPQGPAYAPVQKQSTTQESAGQSFQPPEFSVAASPLQAKMANPVQRQQKGHFQPASQEAPVQRQENLEITSGELTTLGEGSGAATSHIHWPNTAASGVTLGQGYDIGNRTAEQVITELTAAGMGASQATKISAGAGLKGDQANTFVQNNKNDVGEIAVPVQQALLATMLEVYTERAKSTATSTTASGTRNARGREVQEGAEAGTYVMSIDEWDNLHPAMVELLTDLIYQGGYYGYDRVEKINTALKNNDGNHLEQFKAVRELFQGDYMDTYAGKIGEGQGRAGATGNFYGQEVDLAGEYRRNQIRLAYLTHVITALESGSEVTVVKGGNQGDQQESVEPTQELPSGGNTTTAPSSDSSSAVNGTAYTVLPGESLYKLSAKFGVSIEAIKAANMDKLQRWGSVEGFNAGASIIIPGATQQQNTPTPEPTPQVDSTAASSGQSGQSGQSGKSGGSSPDFGGIAKSVLEAAKSAAGSGSIINNALGMVMPLAGGVKLLSKAYSGMFKRNLFSDVVSGLGSLFGSGEPDVAEQIVAPDKQKQSETAEPEKAEGNTKLSELMANDRLTPEQIEEARTLIAAVKDDKQRGDLYVDLQSKVQYVNQRDSQVKSGGTRVEGKNGGICNLASMAMCLSYLGISNPHPEMQFEDALEKVRQDNGFAARTAAGWEQVATKLGAKVSFLLGRGANKANDEAWYKSTVLSEIRDGGSIIMSIKGHIVRMQNVTDEGLVVDDPYGKLNLGKRLEKGRGGYESYNKSEWGWASEGTDHEGEDNVWKWEDVKKYPMWWIASVKK